MTSRPHRSGPSSSSGFSLIESMVAITIVGILVALAVPHYEQWIANSKIRNAQESIQNGLRLARNEAVKRNANVRFELTSATGADWQTCIAQRATPLSCVGSTVLESYASAGGATGVAIGASSVVPMPSLGIALTGGVPGGITFNALGRAVDYGGTAVVRIDASTSLAGSRRLVTTISASGSTRMCDPQLALAVSPQGCF